MGSVGSVGSVSFFGGLGADFSSYSKSCLVLFRLLME